MTPLDQQETIKPSESTTSDDASKSSHPPSITDGGSGDKQAESSTVSKADGEHPNRGPVESNEPVASLSGEEEEEEEEEEETGDSETPESSEDDFPSPPSFIPRSKITGPVSGGAPKPPKPRPIRPEPAVPVPKNRQ